MNRTLAILFALLAVLAPRKQAFSQSPGNLPWPPPRRNITQWILDTKDSITVAAGLTPLAMTQLPPGEQEIRLWIGEGIAAVEHFYRITRRDKHVSGDWFQAWSLGERGGAEAGEPDFNAVLIYSMAGQCRSVGRAGHAHACRVRFTGEPDWKGILERMELAELWTLPDESELPPDSIMVLDGWGMLVEIRDGSTYRVYHHGNPDAHQHPVSQKAAEIAAALNSVDSLLAPAENRKRYRGLLVPGTSHSEFTPCGKVKPWLAQGPVSSLPDSGSRYIEARGLREYPGLTRYYTEYDDGIHIDTVYVNRPWDPKECEALPSGGK
jgi:hypothetical protein